MVKPNEQLYMPKKFLKTRYLEHTKPHVFTHKVYVSMQPSNKLSMHGNVYLVGVMCICAAKRKRLLKKQISKILVCLALKGNKYIDLSKKARGHPIRHYSLLRQNYKF